jgi:diguanylate cyclase (GGDEF)-like protein
MVAIQVLELIRKEDVGVQEIAGLIMNDPALASKIIKTVNSPFYGLTKQVATVSNALVILGLQAAKTLALGFSLMSNLKDRNDPGGFDYGRFWKRSIYAAVGSRVLAQELSLVQQEEAFLAGLLSNMGTLVMHLVIPAEFDPLLQKAGDDYPQLIKLCEEHLQVTPPAVASALAEKWQFPQVLARPIALHHSCDESDPQLKPLVEAVASGVRLADVFVAEDPAPAIARARQELGARFALSPSDIEALLAKIGASATEAAKLLDVNIGHHRSYTEILDEAQEALIALSLQTQQQVQTIKREVQSLQIKATTDPLTGLANRARFDEFFEEQFVRAYQYARPLALLFIDIDNFKMINDLHGHQAGDEVLRRIARMLRSSVRNIDLVARYGGEEFAIVLTETDTDAAAARAELLRSHVASTPIQTREQAISVTISIGVAGTNRSRIFNHQEQLTNAADRAVYAAKHGGRNSVRIFRPRVAGSPEVPVKTALGA